MKTALLLFFVLQGATPAQVPETSTYQHPQVALAFDHPKPWQVVTKKGESKVTIPTEGGGTALLHIYSAIYRSETDIWQIAQLRANEQLKREVVKQWQEEILGVPLLMTKISYIDKGIPLTVLVGLIYSQTPRKMLFRLTVPSDSYDAVETELRGALQTLRTSDGTLPKAEDPNRPVVLGEEKDRTVLSSTRTGKEEAKPKAIEKGPVVVPAEAAGKKVELRLPSGWTAVPAEGGFTVKHADLSEAVYVQILSQLDSDLPQKALFAASTKTLEDYLKVEKRSEMAPKLNRAGATASCIWRIGRGGAGALSTCEAVGSTGDNYWLMRYRASGTPKPTDRKLIDALIEAMSVEVAP